MDRIDELPYAWVFLFFWCGGMARSNMFYWIGRGVAAGTARSRWAAMLDHPLYATAQAWTARWGVLAIPMSFLTVGLQSFIQLSAGVARMPLRHYIPATAVGAVAWATIYTTVGMAVLGAWFSTTTGRIVSVAIIGAFAASVVLQHRRLKQGRLTRAGARAAGEHSPSGPEAPWAPSEHMRS